MRITARDVMQAQVGVVQASASLEELEREFEAAGVSGFPVVEKGRLVGVVSRTDVILARSRGARPQSRVPSFYAEDAATEAREIFETFAEVAGRAVEGLRVEDVMSRSIVAVSPDAELSDVARSLAAYRVHRVLVVEGDALAGVISSLDIVRLVAEGRLRPGADPGSPSAAPRSGA